ncbi:MAG: PAS domain S-box protein [Candidatus Methanofastidiosia archaeon]
MKNNQRKKDYGSLKIISMLLLIVMPIGITYYSIISLNKGTVYTHLFYIPIVMACLWWGRKGVAISGFFSFFLLLNHYFFRTDILWINDIIRVFLFCVVGIIFAYVGEKRNKAESKLKEYTETLEKKVDARTKELKKSEEKAREIAYHMRTLFEISPDLLIVINTDGKITDINRAAEDITGFTRKEMINTNFIDYFTESDNAYDGYHKTLTKGILWNYPLEVHHVKGHATPVLFNAAVFHNKQEDVFAIARDITVQKRAEEEMKKY